MFPKRVGTINVFLHFSTLQEDNQSKSDLTAGKVGTAIKMRMTTNIAQGSLFDYLNSTPNPIGLAVLDCAPPPPPTHIHRVGGPLSLARPAAAVVRGGHYGRSERHCLNVCVQVFAVYLKAIEMCWSTLVKVLCLKISALNADRCV